MSQEPLLSAAEDSQVSEHSDLVLNDDTEVRPLKRQRTEPTYLDEIKEKLTVFNHLSYLVTVTYPGGIEPAHILKLQGWLTQGKPNTPVFYTGSVEGDGALTHRHVHLVVWCSKGVRTDSMSRSLRSSIFTAKELDSIDSARRLVVSRLCTDVAGALCYVFKVNPP